MTLTKKIKHIAALNNETFASIERKLDFGQGTIRKWDNNSPSSDKLKKVARFLDVSIDWLLDESSVNLEVASVSNISTESDETTKEERLFKLLESNFKSLSEAGQDSLVNQSAVLLQKEKEEKENEVFTFHVAARGNSNATIQLTREEIKELERMVKETKPEDLEGVF